MSRQEPGASFVSPPWVWVTHLQRGTSSSRAAGVSPPCVRVTPVQLRLVCHGWLTPAALGAQRFAHRKKRHFQHADVHPSRSGGRHVDVFQISRPQQNSALHRRQSRTCSWNRPCQRVGVFHGGLTPPALVLGDTNPRTLRTPLQARFPTPRWLTPAAPDGVRAAAGRCRGVRATVLPRAWCNHLAVSPSGDRPPDG